MREARTEKIQIMAEPSLMRLIDDWRFANRMGSRAMAMRTLIRKGLNEKGPAEAATSPDHDQNHTTQMENGNDA